MPPQPTPLHEAIETLYIGDTMQREAAVKRLIAIGEPAVPALMDVLTISNAWVLQKRLSATESVAANAQQRDEWARECAIKALRAIGRPAMTPLLEALKHEIVRVRVAAVSALKSIHDPAVTEALRQMLYNEMHLRRREFRKWLFGTLKLLASMAFVFFTLAGLSHQSLASVGAIVCVIAFLFVAGFVDSRWKIRRSAVEGFVNAADTHIVGTLALCLRDRAREVSDVAETGLKKLLPQVQASDKQYITEAEMDALIEALSSPDDELVAAVLKAFEQVGDAKALPKVEWLAVMGAKPVREAAKACLPYLQTQAHKAKQAQELLRPSDSGSATAPNTLLRPAQAGNTTTEETQLLRPSG